MKKLNLILYTNFYGGAGDVEMLTPYLATLLTPLVGSYDTITVRFCGTVSKPHLQNYGLSGEGLDWEILIPQEKLALASLVGKLNSICYKTVEALGGTAQHIKYFRVSVSDEGGIGQDMVYTARKEKGFEDAHLDDKIEKVNNLVDKRHEGVDSILLHTNSNSLLKRQASCRQLGSVRCKLYLTTEVGCPDFVLKNLEALIARRHALSTLYLAPCEEQISRLPLYLHEHSTPVLPEYIAHNSDSLPCGTKYCQNLMETSAKEGRVQVIAYFSVESQKTKQLVTNLIVSLARAAKDWGNPVDLIMAGREAHQEVLRDALGILKCEDQAVVCGFGNGLRFLYSCQFTCKAKYLPGLSHLFNFADICIGTGLKSALEVLGSTAKLKLVQAAMHNSGKDHIKFYQDCVKANKLSLQRALSNPEDSYETSALEDMWSEALAAVPPVPAEAGGGLAAPKPQDDGSLGGKKP